MASGRNPNTSGRPTGLRALRFSDRYAALGMATAYLMQKPAFARLSFGHWSRVLTGQINRDHYLFVCDETSAVGFAGWAFCRREEAEAWLSGDLSMAPDDTMTGGCLVLNAWAADQPRVHAFMLHALRPVASGATAVYARRDYADGRSRPVRLRLLSGSRATPVLAADESPTTAAEPLPAG